MAILRSLPRTCNTGLWGAQASLFVSTSCRLVACQSWQAICQGCPCKEAEQMRAVQSMLRRQPLRCCRQLCEDSALLADRLHGTAQALCVCVLQAGLAYKRCFAAHTDYKSEAYQADLAAVHQQVGLC